MIADFRNRDIAAGGQGAPLAPAFHRAAFHQPGEHRVVVNIGGVANLTVLPGDGEGVIGFDSGPGNTLMDRWIARHLGLPYDRDGAWAAGGRACDKLLARLLDDEYFHLPPPKSTGQEYFSSAWLERCLIGLALDPRDAQATLCRLTAQTIAQAAREYAPSARRVLVCGGGARNGHLMNELAGLLPCPVTDTQAAGVAPEWVEAAAFAWLARQTLHGAPGNLPAVTGARRALSLGGVYRA